MKEIQSHRAPKDVTELLTIQNLHPDFLIILTCRRVYGFFHQKQSFICYIFFQQHSTFIYHFTNVLYNFFSVLNFFYCLFQVCSYREEKNTVESDYI